MLDETLNIRSRPMSFEAFAVETGGYLGYLLREEVTAPIQRKRRTPVANQV